MTYDTMNENGRTYYRAQCDYPGCEAKYEGDEYEYWETPDLAAEDATNLDMWLAMTDWNGNVLFFCPKHLRLNKRGYTLGYDFDNPRIPTSQSKTEHILRNRRNHNPPTGMRTDDTQPARTPKQR